jgi:hypothetical protein
MTCSNDTISLIYSLFTPSFSILLFDSFMLLIGSNTNNKLLYIVVMGYLDILFSIEKGFNITLFSHH